MLKQKALNKTLLRIKQKRIFAGKRWKPYLRMEEDLYMTSINTWVKYLFSAVQCNRPCFSLTFSNYMDLISSHVSYIFSSMNWSLVNIPSDVTKLMWHLKEPSDVTCGTISSDDGQPSGEDSTQSCVIQNDLVQECLTTGSKVIYCNNAILAMLLSFTSIYVCLVKLICNWWQLMKVKHLICWTWLNHFCTKWVLNANITYLWHKSKCMMVAGVWHAELRIVLLLPCRHSCDWAALSNCVICPGGEHTAHKAEITTPRNPPLMLLHYSINYLLEKS